MTATIAVLKRQFQFGATRLDDPAPSLTPQDALRLFEPNYPFLATARLGEPTIQGDLLVYPVLKPEVQVKGASNRQPADKTLLRKAIGAVKQWSDAPAAMVQPSPAWHLVFSRVDQVSRRADSPVRDAFDVPLA